MGTIPYTRRKIKDGYSSIQLRTEQVSLCSAYRYNITLCLSVATLMLEKTMPWA